MQDNITFKNAHRATMYRIVDFMLKTREDLLTTTAKSVMVVEMNNMPLPPNIEHTLAQMLIDYYGLVPLFKIFLTEKKDEEEFHYDPVAHQLYDIFFNLNTHFDTKVITEDKDVKALGEFFEKEKAIFDELFERIEVKNDFRAQ